MPSLMRKQEQLPHIQATYNDAPSRLIRSAKKEVIVENVDRKTWQSEFEDLTASNYLLPNPALTPKVMNRSRYKTTNNFDSLTQSMTREQVLSGKNAYGQSSRLGQMITMTDQPQVDEQVMLQSMHNLSSLDQMVQMNSSRPFIYNNVNVTATGEDSRLMSE